MGEPETSLISLEARLEALLFASPMPISPAQAAQALGVSKSSVEQALQSMHEGYRSRGIRLQRSKDRLQLTTAPEAAADVQRLLSLEDTSRLSRAALEVLAIIAYQQPVTRPQIDAIRGVNSDSVLRTLLRHGLIDEVGRSDGPGRPILYATTPEFLSHFGLEALEDLPPLSPTEELRAPDMTPSGAPPD